MRFTGFMTDRERLTYLRLKQARRREIPIHMVALFIGALVVYVLLEAAAEWLRVR